jgi:hypothetical protein
LGPAVTVSVIPEAYNIDVIKRLADMDHEQRVRSELVKAGVTSYGLKKTSIRHIPDVVQEDEHVKGVIYGWREANTATIVATDKRLIYMDHKPFFRINDEISYDFVSGVSLNTQGRFSGVIIHTRAGDYNLRFVNTECAKIFVKYIETRGIANLKNRDIGSAQRPIENLKKVASSLTPASAPVPSSASKKSKQSIKPITSEVKNFLMTHDTCVLSTVDIDGSPSGAVVNYIFSEENYFYIVTKDMTKKAQNIAVNNRVAITIFDIERRATIQSEGTAELIADPNYIKSITSKLIKPQQYGDKVAWPPISLLIAGDYVVVKVTPVAMKFIDFD